MDYKQVEKVASKADFVKFLQELSRDFEDNTDEWENWTISAYLESISAYISDDDDEKLDSLDYKSIADIFYSGKHYE